MKLICSLLFLSTILILINGCDTSGTQIGSSTRVRIELSGSSTVGPLAAEIAKRYEEIEPRVQVNVQTGGSSRGIADARNGLADIGMSSRALKDSEKEGRKSWPIAMDGVCFIIHASNTVSELSREDLLAIMQGEKKNWKELGGKDEPIVFINRAAGRSELELVTKYFDVKADQIVADLIAGENQQGIKNVAGVENSISYMSVGASEDAIARGTQIRMLPMNGINASVATVESGEFPLSRPLILVTNDNPSEPVKSFIQFAQSADVSDLVRELSYVPIPE